MWWWKLCVEIVFAIFTAQNYYATKSWQSWTDTRYWSLFYQKQVRLLVFVYHQVFYLIYIYNLFLHQPHNWRRKRIPCNTSFPLGQIPRNWCVSGKKKSTISYLATIFSDKWTKEYTIQNSRTFSIRLKEMARSMMLSYWKIKTTS